MSAPDWDAIVIGAGPAGLSAAATLAEGGARTLLVDEQAAPGGQIYRCVERNLARPRLAAILGRDYAQGAALVARARASGATLRFSTSVWRVEDGPAAWTRGEQGVRRESAHAVVIATGAMERPAPVEGWTLPGVTTVGALQILLKSDGLVPSGRLVLAGSGPLLYLFGAQCLAAGVASVTILDTARRANLPAALARLPVASSPAWRVLAKGLGLITRLAAGARVVLDVSGLAIEGGDRAGAVRYVAQGREARIACDLVALHEGVIPQQQMTRALGCAHDWNAAQRCFQPRRDARGAIAREGVYVVGDAGGIIGARASVEDGTAAALAILARRGLIAPDLYEKRRRAVERARAAHVAIRPFLDALYPPPPRLRAPADAVVICRCEGVSAGALRALAAQGVRGPRQAKAFLRCGMGPCQGRWCGTSVTSILAETLGVGEAQIGYDRGRDPVKPVTVGDVAGACRDDHGEEAAT